MLFGSESAHKSVPVRFLPEKLLWFLREEPSDAVPPPPQLSLSPALWEWVFFRQSS